MIFSWLWATLPGEVGQSVFDFFSFGHLAMGVVVFSLLTLISTIRNVFDPKHFKVQKSHWMWFFIGTIIFAVFWEIVENTLLLSWGLKHLNTADSIINAIADIILGGISALMLWCIGYLLYEKVKKYEFLLFYLIAALSFVVFYVIYLVLVF
ncbi:MAG: hypothetical protein ACW98X_12700 [Promethearchaeota archaeon]|jgi:hypothetical protein